MSPEEEAEMKLQGQLKEIGNSLQKPPQELDKLLSLLQVVENYLGRVEQSPSESMTSVITPTINALVAPVLMRHPDKDVKLSVATCISEITRITAPEAPYNDNLMKEIFQLIVSTFGELLDPNSPSFPKRLLILETVAKVRSCVVMLDLECDDLILEMFRHFLNTIREDHPEAVYASMEAIMTCVLEESEDMPVELATVLLDKLKIENQEVSPVVRRLVEKVLTCCTEKVKSPLVEAVKSRGVPVTEYSQVIVRICQDGVDTPDINESAASGKNSGGLAKGGDKPSVHAGDDASDKSTKLKLSNGSAKSGKDGSSGENVSTQKKSDNSLNDHPKNASAASEAKSEPSDIPSQKPDSLPVQNPKKNKARKLSVLKKSLESSDDIENSTKGEVIEEDVKLENQADQSGKGKSMSSKTVKEARGRKSNSSKQSVESSGDAPTISEARTPVVTEDKTEDVDKLKVSSKKNKGTTSNSVKEPAEKTATEHSVKRKGRPPKDSGQSNIEVKVAPESEVKISGQAVSPKKKGETSSTPTHKEDLPNKSGVKRGRPKSSLKKDEPKTKSGTDDSPAEAEDEKESPEAKAVGPSSEEKTSKSRGRRLKEASQGKNVDNGKTGESSSKKSTGSRRSSAETEDAPSNSKGSSLTGSKRKASLPKDEPSGSTDRRTTPDASLVGSKIKVWWPIDKAFYEGLIESYDDTKKKHKVVYVDGDTEDLLLSKERWEMVKEKEQAKGNSTSDSPGETNVKKKVKSTSSSSSKGKSVVDAPTTKRKESSSGKAKEAAPKSAGKSGGDGSSSKGKSGSSQESKGKKQRVGRG